MELETARLRRNGQSGLINALDPSGGDQPAQTASEIARCGINRVVTFWRSLKYEAVYLQDIADGFAAQRIIDTWMNFYNQERPHSALGKATP